MMGQICDILKYEGDNSTFIWKHPLEDFNSLTQLIVHESQEAIFFMNGQALDLFGPGRYTLETENIPLLRRITNIPTNGQTPFHCEVYFINKTEQMAIRWGTDSKVRLFDPASGLHVELGASGNFNMRVTNSRKLLLKLVGTTAEFRQEDVNGDDNAIGTTFVKGKFRALIMNKVKSNLAREIRENQINILEIDEYLDILSEKLKVIINGTLEDYGLTMPEFYITTIVTPDDDPNFRRLKQQYAEKTLRVREENIKRAEAEAAQSRKILEAQTEAQLKMVSAQGEAEALKIKAQAEAEAYKAQAYAEAEEMRAKGYTYQQETARQVGLQAMQNGITGGNGSGAASALGDLAGLGISLGAMGSVIGMTKDAINPVMGQTMQMGSQMGSAFGGQPGSASGDTWDCPNCGAKGIHTKFCPDCGAPRPLAEPVKPVVSDAWDCPNCGCQGITTKFCPECGTPRPNPFWNCPDCGTTNIKTKFCPNCGRKREG